MQEGTREVHATGLLCDLEDAVLARPARSVPGHRWARRRRIWRRSLGGVVGSAAGPAERGGGGGTAGAAADRPGRLHRRGVLPGAGQTVLASVDVLSNRALLADPATTALRGGNALPSVFKSAARWRFLAGADLGRVTKAAAMAAGGAPDVTGSFITAPACGLFALTAYASGVLISQLSTSARSGTALAVQFRPGGPVPTHQRLG